MRFILSIKIPVIPPPATSNWVCYNKMADQGVEILIIQGSDLGLGTQEYFQFSVYSPSYAPFWQEVITVIVALSPKLKLSRTLWGSGVQICCVFSISYLEDIGFIQPPWPSLSSKGWIQTIANQGREGDTETEEKGSNGGGGAALR